MYRELFESYRLLKFIYATRLVRVRYLEFQNKRSIDFVIE